MGCGGVLLHDQDDVVLRLKGVVELDEVHVVQLVHDTDLGSSRRPWGREGWFKAGWTRSPAVRTAWPSPYLSFTPLVLMILASPA